MKKVNIAPILVQTWLDKLKQNESPEAKAIAQKHIAAVFKTQEDVLTFVQENGLKL